MHPTKRIDTSVLQHYEAWVSRAKASNSTPIASNSTRPAPVIPHALSSDPRNQEETAMSNGDDSLRVNRPLFTLHQKAFRVVRNEDAILEASYHMDWPIESSSGRLVPYVYASLIDGGSGGCGGCAVTDAFVRKVTRSSADQLQSSSNAERIFAWASGRGGNSGAAGKALQIKCPSSFGMDDGVESTSSSSPPSTAAPRITINVGIGGGAGHNFYLTSSSHDEIRDIIEHAPSRIIEFNAVPGMPGTRSSILVHSFSGAPIKVDSNWPASNDMNVKEFVAQEVHQHWGAGRVMVRRNQETEQLEFGCSCGGYGTFSYNECWMNSLSSSMASSTACKTNHDDDSRLELPKDSRFSLMPSYCASSTLECGHKSKKLEASYSSADNSAIAPRLDFSTINGRAKIYTVHTTEDEAMDVTNRCVIFESIAGGNGTCGIRRNGVSPNDEEYPPPLSRSLLPVAPLAHSCNVKVGISKRSLARLLSTPWTSSIPFCEDEQEIMSSTAGFPSPMTPSSIQYAWGAEEQNNLSSSSQQPLESIIQSYGGGGAACAHPFKLGQRYGDGGAGGAIPRIVYAQEETNDDQKLSSVMHRVFSPKRGMDGIVILYWFERETEKT